MEFPTIHLYFLVIIHKRYRTILYPARENMLANTMQHTVCTAFDVKDVYDTIKYWLSTK